MLLEICSGQKCDGRTVRRTDKAATICSPFGEHKNMTPYVVQGTLLKIEALIGGALLREGYPLCSFLNKGVHSTQRFRLLGIVEVKYERYKI